MRRSAVQLAFWLVGSMGCPIPQETPQVLPYRVPAPPELPPDLTHISATGCHLRQYPIDVFNAQMKTSDELHYVEVIGFVKFEKAPAGEEWTVSLGTYPSPDADTIPKETVDRCVSWKKKLREAIVEDQHKRGHAAKEKK